MHRSAHSSTSLPARRRVMIVCLGELMKALLRGGSADHVGSGGPFRQRCPARPGPWLCQKRSLAVSSDTTHCMKPRQPILLPPYRLPTESTLYLGDEEVAAFLNGWRALWHPAALACAESLPRLASPYDYEEPTDGLLIGIPDNP